MMDVPFAAARRVGVEAQSNQPVRKVVCQRSSKVESNHHYSSRTMNKPCKFDDPVSIELGSHGRETFNGLIETVVYVINDAAFFTSRRFQHRVRGDLHDEVAPEIYAEIGKALVAHRLNGSHYSRRVHIVSFGQFARGEKTGLFAVVENRSHQLLALWSKARLRLGKTRLKRGL